MNLLEQLNNMFDEVQKNKVLSNTNLNEEERASAIAKIEAETNNLTATVQSEGINGLNPSANPGAAFVPFCGDMVIDLACSRSYLLSTVLRDSFIGGNVETYELITAIVWDSELYAFSDADDCDAVGELEKGAKKIQMKPAMMDAICEINDSMKNGKTRGQLIMEIIDKNIVSAINRSVEQLLINGDPRVAAGNINNITAVVGDKKPASTAGKGLRYSTLVDFDTFDAVTKTPSVTAVTPATTTYDFGGAVTSVEQLDALALLSDCSEEFVYVTDKQTFFKLRALLTSLPGGATCECLRDAVGYADGAKFFDFMGRTFYVSSVMPKVDATGVVSATATNNTFGSIIGFRPKAVRWGYTQPTIFKKLSSPRCEKVYAAVYFSFAICQDNDQPNVILGYNIK